MKLTPEQHKEHSLKIKQGQARSNKKTGRPSKVSKDQVLRLYQTKSVIEIANLFEVSRQTIYNIIKKS